MQLLQLLDVSMIDWFSREDKENCARREWERKRRWFMMQWAHWMHVSFFSKTRFRFAGVWRCCMDPKYAWDAYETWCIRQVVFDFKIKTNEPPPLSFLCHNVIIDQICERARSIGGRKRWNRAWKQTVGDVDIPFELKEKIVEESRFRWISMYCDGDICVCSQLDESTEPFCCNVKVFQYHFSPRVSNSRRRASRRSRCP